MFRKRMLKMLYLAFNVSGYFGGCPVTIDVDSQHFLIDKTIIQKLRRNFIFAALWNILAYIILLKRYLNHENLDEFHITLAWCLGYTLIFLVYSISRFRSAEICDAANGLVNLLNSEKAKHMPKFNPNKAKGMFMLSDASLLLFYLACFLLYMFCITVLLQDPKGVIYIGGLGPSKYFTFPVALAVVTFHAYMFAVICTSMAASGGLIIMYAYYLCFMISQELCLGRIKYIADEKFRTGQNIRIFYRSLQVLHQHTLLHCNFGIYVVIGNAFCEASAIYLTFVLIRYWKELRVFSKAPFIVGDILSGGYWSVLLQMGRMFYLGGCKTLGSWKRHNWGFQEQNKLMSKFIRSCRMILISYGKQFIIGRTSVLNYYKSVERGTFRVLLLTK